MFALGDYWRGKAFDPVQRHAGNPGHFLEGAAGPDPRLDIARTE
jgi:hypothetical protein